VIECAEKVLLIHSGRSVGFLLNSPYFLVFVLLLKASRVVYLFNGKRHVWKQIGQGTPEVLLAASSSLSSLPLEPSNSLLSPFGSHLKEFLWFEIVSWCS